MGLRAGKLVWIKIPSENAHVLMHLGEEGGSLSSPAGRENATTLLFLNFIIELKFFYLFLFYFYVYRYFACMYFCAPDEFLGTHRGKERVSYLLRLKLETVVCVL